MMSLIPRLASLFDVLSVEIMSPRRLKTGEREVDESGVMTLFRGAGAA
ncbi:hypothetical protein [Sorangium sp. So ce513]